MPDGPDQGKMTSLVIIATALVMLSAVMAVGSEK